MKNFQNDTEEEDDDFITFQLDSYIIKFHYSNLTKYSKLIRNNYLFPDVKNRLLQELLEFQKQYDINSDNIILFFQLLNEDFIFARQLEYKQCIDLFKISELLQVKKLSLNLFQYIKGRDIDTDFQIQIILHEAKSNKNTENFPIRLNTKIEDFLSTKIADCLQNENFSQLPISIIFRIVEKSDKQHLQNDMLYDFIKKDVNTFYLLFSFLDIKNLSEDRFNEMLHFSNDDNGPFKPFLNYLPSALSCLMKLNDEKKIFKQENDQLRLDLKDAMKQKDDIQNQFENLKQEQSKLMDDFRSIESEKDAMQRELSDVKSEKEKMEPEIIKLRHKLEDAVKQLDELKNCPFEGIIKAKKKSDMILNAEIKLFEKSAKLDTNASKYIISQSNEKKLGESAYEYGEAITSLNQTCLDFSGKPGTYYVRALVVDVNGKSTEFVSNPVTLNGKFLSFAYEGRAAELFLAAGRYKLEVWGAKGGDSKGKKIHDSRLGRGGLGGYSVGNLSLQKSTKLFVYVGGQGQASKEADGAETDGAFPDGGGTKTGHCSNNSPVSGTGGGSTSIRLVSDSLYTRVIVAGGGGGAGGNCYYTDDGGFGGGKEGGNSYIEGELAKQGAGTQTGSTPGPEGEGTEGVAGTFGKGATCLYRQRSESGGGGGGGWYGGGGGGNTGGCNPSSGGGGSGWIFTEASFSAWTSGDSSHAKNFQLSSSFYLTDASTKPGSESFPSPEGGNETGHNGDGYAKITPI